MVFSMWSSGLKKQQKRPRVPKRGPGVAELEKILREQETIDITDRGNNAEGFSIPSPCFIPHHPNHYPLKPHPRPTSPPPSGRITVPSAPKFDHLCTATPPTMTSMYGNSGPLLGRNGNGGGSGLVSQEQELFPMNLSSSCKSKPNLNEGVDGSQSDHSGNSPSSESNPARSYPPTIQKRNNNQFPPPMMNQILGTSTLASSGSLSMGLHNHNHLEPPSNQSSYYHYTSRIPEENKMVGMKRSHSLSLDNSLIPPSNFQVLPSFSRYNRSHQSSTNDNQGLSSFNSTNECYRDAKWGNTLELSSRRLNSDIVGLGHGHGHANFPPFATPEVPPPPMHLFQGVLSKGKMLPCQVIEDKKEDSCQRSESSGPDRRPFYNFLEVNDPDGVTEATRDSNHGGREARRGGLDLSLKL